MYHPLSENYDSYSFGDFHFYFLFIGVCTDTYVIYQSFLQKLMNLEFIGKSAWIITNHTWLERGDSKLSNGILYVKIG